LLLTTFFDSVIPLLSIVTGVIISEMNIKMIEIK